MKLLWGALFISAIVPVAALATNYEIGSPGALSGSVPAIIRVIDSAYDYAFLIGGFLAFAAIVYGGVRYTFSGGSHSAESDARDQITQAVLGLLLLLGAYVVLNTISPTLTSFQLPTLDKIEDPPLVALSPCNDGRGCTVADQECVQSSRGPRCVPRAEAGNAACGSDCKPATHACRRATDLQNECRENPNDSVCDLLSSAGGFVCVPRATQNNPTSPQRPSVVCGDTTCNPDRQACVYDRGNGRYLCMNRAINCSPECLSGWACVGGVVGVCLPQSEAAANETDW